MEANESLGETNLNSQNIGTIPQNVTKNKTLEQFTAEAFKMLVEATKKSNKLPFGKARDMYESYPSFHTLMGSQSDYVMSLLSVVMKHTNSKGNIQKRDDEDKLEMIIDINDALLENVGTSLDEISGIKRNPEPQFIAKKLQAFNGSWNRTATIKTVDNKAATQVLNMILNKTKNIEKPQLNFEDKVNNDPNVPFEPKIKYKYNMLKPLSAVAEVDENGICHFTHPYEFELMKFKPPPEQLENQPPKPFKSLEETTFKFVTTSKDVEEMVEDLEKYKELAVDLEHHSYRSFQGFTCLLQISTRDTDYVIDAIALRSKLQLLNKVLTDPSVVKVFHGADLDILWLQRDLALYVVNMFDTHQAAKLLNFPKLSLAYLLAFYVNVEAQKHFQLADWRIRPLPDELLAYAREDTHYLLYIYDMLRNTLIEKANGQKNLLENVMKESTRLCMKRYVKPLYDPEGYLDIYQRSKKLFDNRQKFALQSLFEWRDNTARELDESYAYVLPNHMMLNISEVLPREAQGILACCNPIPAPVRQNLLKLHQLILKAREQPLIKPVLEEQRFFKYTSSINSLENPLQCPHDLNHETEFRDDLPVLFVANGEEAVIETHNKEPSPLSFIKPVLDVFEKSTEPSKKASSVIKVEKSIPSTPYQRYKLAKKYSESIEASNIVKTNKDKLEKEEEKATQSAQPTDSSMEIKVEEIKKEKEDSTANVQIESEKSIREQLKANKKKAANLKRKMKNEKEENEPVKVKKLKEENAADLVANPFYDSLFNESNGEESKNRKKNKKVKKNFLVMKEKEFKAFDYNSVDYKKYQTAATVKNKKPEKKGKRWKKGGKKNFKIAV